MLTETFFNITDATEVQSAMRQIKKFGRLVILAGIPAELLFAFLASKIFTNLFWPIFATGTLILVLTYFFVFLRGLRRYQQDLNEQIKLAGEVEVVSKSDKDKAYLIGLNSPNLEKLYVTKPSFDNIDPGEMVYLEVSKYAQVILKLSKNGQSLLNSYQTKFTQGSKSSLL